MEVSQRRAYARRGALRRTSGYRRGRDSGLREAVLIQCIVSGIMIIAALTVSLLPVQGARDLRGGIKQALSKESSAESLFAAANDITVRYNEMKASIQTIFGGEAPAQSKEADEPIEVSEPDAVPVGSFDSTTVPVGIDARVDESILNSVNFFEELEIPKK